MTEEKRTTASAANTSPHPPSTNHEELPLTNSPDLSSGTAAGTGDGAAESAAATSPRQCGTAEETEDGAAEATAAAGAAPE